MSESLIDILKNTPAEKRQERYQMYMTQKTRREHYPYSGRFELTPLCTLDCKMCYIHLKADQVSQYGRILSCEEWNHLADEFVKIGVSSITITGGECMLYPDFKKVYKHAYDLGLSISLMTNATLIDEEMADFLANNPPYIICITLYGFSPETYEKACGNGAAFDKVIRGITLLKERKIKLLLQSTVTEDMIHDLPAIAQYAKDNGLDYVYSGNLKANRECTNECVLQNAVSVDEMDAMRRKIAEIRGIEYREPPLISDEDIAKVQIREKGIMCGAAVNSFHINWKGEMTPCVTFDAYKTYPLVEGLREAWVKMYKWAETVPQMTECQKCKYKLRCATCIPLHYGDTHEFGVPSPRLCYKVQHNITEDTPADE